MAQASFSCPFRAIHLLPRSTRRAAYTVGKWRADEGIGPYDMHLCRGYPILRQPLGARRGRRPRRPATPQCGTGVPCCANAAACRRGRRPRRPARGNRRFCPAPGRMRKTAIVPPGGRGRPPLRNGRTFCLYIHISDTGLFRAVGDARPYGGDGHFPLITHKLNGNPQANTHPRRCVFAFFN